MGSHIKAGGVPVVGGPSLIFSPTSGVTPTTAKVSTFPLFVLPMSFSQFRITRTPMGLNSSFNLAMTPNTTIRYGAKFWRIG